MAKETNEKTGSRNHRITTQMLGSGMAAVHLADFEDIGWNTDVVQTGLGRYRGKDATQRARNEAKSWAEAEGIPYVEK